MKKHLVLAVVFLSAPLVHAGNPAMDMGRAARNFLKGLNPEQKAKTTFKFSDEERAPSSKLHL